MGSLPLQLYGFEVVLLVLQAERYLMLERMDVAAIFLLLK